MEPSLPRVFGAYYLLAPLGKGAAGAAYLAKPLDPSKALPPVLVVKCLHTRLAGEDEFVRRFVHEAEIAVRLDSPHVARTYDVGAVGETMYIALDYVPGWTLGKLLAHHVEAETAPPIDVACGVVAQAADGLAALHAAVDHDGRPLEAIHRDVSPKNVMVGDDGVVRVIDFGLGRSKAQDWKTAAGRVMGSPGYMPPEQIRGESVDRRADVYALGVVLHELLVGARYIDADGSVERLKQTLEKPFVAPSSLRAAIPSALDAIVRRAMAPERAERTPDAGALADALRSFGVAPTSAVAEWVRSALEDLQTRRRKRVAELLAMEPPSSEVESAKTRIFVRRGGLAAHPEEDVAPPPVVRVREEPMERSPRRVWGLGLIVGVVAGIATGVWVASGERSEAPLAIDPTEARVLVEPRSERPVVVEAAEPAPSGSVSDPAPSPSTEPPPPRRRTRTRRRAPPAVAAPSAPEPTPAIDRARSLARRLSAVKTEDPETRARVARLLAQVSMIRNAPPSSRLDSQLDGIEREVRALEQ